MEGNAGEEREIPAEIVGMSRPREKQEKTYQIEHAWTLGEVAAAKEST
jgi:hypothetical protein